MYVENQMHGSGLPRIHCFVYADPGRWKSTFAASFPKPMLVLATDPLDKLMPYRRRGLVGQRVNPKPDEGIYVPTEYVMSTKDPSKVVIQMEYYIDRTMYDPELTSAWEQLQDRMLDLWDEDLQGKWATVVLDSLSSLEYVIRCHYQFKENPVTKEGNEQDQRQWYRKSAEGIERICYGLAWAQANVVILAHVRGEKDAIRETVVWTPEAPGTRNRKLTSVFGEVYTMHLDPDIPADSDKCPVFMQTRPDRQWIAATQIPAPDDCDPNYAALWQEYKPLKEARNVRATQDSQHG